MDVISQIGVAAALEQCGEESAELAQACLKMARKLRGENPTPKTIEELSNSLVDEMADVLVCIDILLDNNVVSNQDVIHRMLDKHIRWATRLEEEKSKGE